MKHVWRRYYSGNVENGHENPGIVGYNMVGWPVTLSGFDGVFYRRSWLISRLWVRLTQNN